MTNTNTLKITAKDAPTLLLDTLKGKKVPFLTSSPGIGKSCIIRSIASKERLKVIDLRLSQCDPTDLGGFPMINKETNKASYFPMDTFPIEGDKIPLDSEGNPYNGWLIFLDEMSAATPAVQAASYKIILDREVGLHKLHKNVAIICAGNLATDKAIVNRLSTALQSRVVHFEMQANLDDWMEWAATADIDYRVKAFIAFRPELLHKFDANHNEKTFPCPRTWEFVSDIIKPWKKIETVKTPVIAGCVGEGAGYQFLSFCDLYGKIPTIEQILNDPENVHFDKEPSMCYALSSMIANYIKDSNADILMKAMARLPLEFQLYSLKGAIANDLDLMDNFAIMNWVSKFAKDLM